MTFPMVAFATGFLGAMLGDRAALGLRFGILGGEGRFVQDSCSTVDGSEIRRSPVDMVNIPLFTGFYTHQVVGNGISEPSTVYQFTYSYYIVSKTSEICHQRFPLTTDDHQSHANQDGCG